MKIYKPAALCLISAGTFSLHAQPVNVQQFQNLQQAQQFQPPLSALKAGTNAPDLYPGEATDVGPQHILRYNPRPVYFDVFADSQVFYSDNANFAQPSAALCSAVYVNTVQVAFTPPDLQLGPGRFVPAVGYVNQWYNYGRADMISFDFIAETAFVSGRYTVGNWQFGLGGNFTQLVDQGSNDRTYDEWLPAFTIQHFFPLTQKLLFSVGNQMDYHFSSVPYIPGAGGTEINNRFDDAANLTLVWQITKHLALQPYYNFQYSNYRYNTVRSSQLNGYLSSFGLTLAFAFNKNFSLRAFFNGNYKQSNDPNTPSYHEYNGGIGATANFNF